VLGSSRGRSHLLLRHLTIAPREVQGGIGVDRYYDPTTGQFLTVDPDVDETDQPNAYTGDDPVNAVDPLGLADCGANPFCYVGSAIDKTNNALNSAMNWASRRTNSSNFGPGGGSLKGWLAEQAGCGSSSSSPDITCTFSFGGITSGPYNWGDLSTLLDHFGRHGPDFGSQSPEEYAQQASSFLEQMVSEGEIRIDSRSGVIRVYNPETNTFGSYNPDGTTKTMFNSEEGESYWEKQFGSEPWFGGE
jgi:hypothetical protein